ncbi:MAG: MFS transporter, partial [Planctomycetota bacterium]
MSAAELPAESPAVSPPLAADRSFWAMLVTQFLGAFNDNVFKQLVLLVCLDYKLAGNADYQDVAQGVFALPFVLLSGLWGWLGDRWPKRAIIVGCKVGEIVIMSLGAVALWIGGGELGQLVALLLCVLAFMGAQSAAFGPSKYGILPELFRGGDLPKANGWVQMTTFLAIILGIVTAGTLKANGAALPAIGA